MKVALWVNDTSVRTLPGVSESGKESTERATASFAKMEREREQKRKGEEQEKYVCSDSSAAGFYEMRPPRPSIVIGLSGWLPGFLHFGFPLDFAHHTVSII